MNGIPNWLIAISVWLCKVLGGPPGYSLCAWFWHMRLQGHPLGRPLAWAADTLFFWDKEHCRKSWYLRVGGIKPPVVRYY